MVTIYKKSSGDVLILVSRRPWSSNAVNTRCTTLKTLPLYWSKPKPIHSVAQPTNEKISQMSRDRPCIYMEIQTISFLPLILWFNKCASRNITSVSIAIETQKADFIKTSFGQFGLARLRMEIVVKSSFFADLSR